MGKRVTLESNRLRIILGDPTDLDNEDEWVELIVQTRSADNIGAEALFRARKWGTPMDSPIKYSIVTGYCALKRTRQIEGTWEQYEASLIESTVVDADGEPTDKPGAERPTEPGPGPG